MKKSKLFCLGALLLAVPSLTTLGMSTPPNQVGASVAPRVEATAPAALAETRVAQATSTAWPTITLTRRFSGLNRPVQITNAKDGSGRLFVVEQSGRIRIIKNGALLSTPFLNISSRVSCCGEQGLLGVAFPPNYARKRYFYVYYTNASGNIVVARYRVTTNPDLANSNSQEVVLTINHPTFANHNGGQLVFGPDGYLYIGTGDGGSGGDPRNNAQNPASLLGKLLRIDVESGKTPYAIPSSNPFRKTTGYRPEIWARGLRNPWRFSFDRKTGDLYIADVGQNEYEEIDFQSAASKGGQNYGWRIMEGKHCYESTTCNRKGLVLPVAEYNHQQGQSVTGGFVYRGQAYPDLQGVYFYADFISGKIWGLRRRGSAWQSKLLKQTEYSISSFGEDEAGNVYVVDYSGNIYLIKS